MHTTLNKSLFPVLCATLLNGCASMMSQATNNMSANLSSAILNQDDPEIVRDGAPAYLLMLDSFVEGSPNDPRMLGAAAELYAAYGVLFVEDRERAGRLTARALVYAERGLCASNDGVCGLETLSYPDFLERLELVHRRDVPALYTYSLAWLAYIRVHSAEMSALAKLPRAEAALLRVQQLDPGYQQADVQHYLGVLATIRPPALGGRFDEGRRHFESAIELSAGRKLSVLVDFARYYARTLYERELHDELLGQVLAADPVQEDQTLFNVLAQRTAEELLASADDHF